MTVVWMWFLKSRIGKMIASVVLGISLMGSILLFTFRKGQKDQEKNQRIKDLKRFKETSDAINKIKPSPDRESALKRLHERGKLRD